MRILFDSTFSATSGKKSGIERVVRSLQKAALGLQTIESLNSVAVPQVDVEPVFIHDGKIYKLGKEAEKEFLKVSEIQADCMRIAPPGYSLCATVFCKVVRSRQVQRWLLPSPGHLGIFKSIYKRKSAFAFRQAAARSTQVQIDDSDILWLPDAYWATADVWPAIILAKHEGACVATLVYDLIPLQDGSTGEIDIERNRHFYHYLDTVVRCSDVILTISETIREQLNKLIDSKWPGPFVCREIHAIPLGAEINHVSGPVRTAFTDFFGNDGSAPPYVCIGTFEPRKNQEFVLDTFEELWKKSSGLRLCMIGRVGWQCEKIVDRLRHHPELGHRLLVCHTATDAEVNFSYRNCRALVTASKSEGFGLPIVEALWHGRPVLASDIPVHREVGKTECHYFPLGEPDGLCQAVSDLEQRLSSGENVETRPARPTEWSDSWAICRAELIQAFVRKRDHNQQVATKP